VHLHEAHILFTRVEEALDYLRGFFEGYWEDAGYLGMAPTIESLGFHRDRRGRVS